MNPRLLLIALLCLFAFPAGASAQPFWPDPEEAYPYAPDPYEVDPETLHRPSFETPPPTLWRDPRAGMQAPRVGPFPQQQTSPAAVSIVEADLVPSFNSATRQGRVVLTITLKNESTVTLTNLSFTLRITDRHGRLIARESLTGSGRVVLPGFTTHLDETVLRFACAPKTPSESCAGKLAPLDLAVWRAAQEGGWRANIENFSSSTFGGR